MLRRSLVVLAAATIAFTAAACSDSGGSSGSVKEFCSLDQSKAFQDVDDPKAMAAALDDAKDKAPKEVKKDVEILADAINEYAEKTDGLDKADPKFLEASASMATPEVQKAIENITKFSNENCK